MESRALLPVRGGGRQLTSGLQGGGGLPPPRAQIWAAGGGGGSYRPRMMMMSVSPGVSPFGPVGCGRPLTQGGEMYINHTHAQEEAK
jgi:hypothetical protein